jgi:hypothetical protein
LLSLLLALCSGWVALFIDKRFLFFPSKEFFVLVRSRCGSLADDHLCSGSNSPDESQQFTGDCSNDLSLSLASRT